MARQYYPRVQVLLHPIVSWGSKTDITEWFGEGSVITTSKGVLEPSGHFTLSFLDRPIDENDSVYSRLHPMDGIEIRACHDGKKPLKTIMRGFVSHVSRSEEMGQDGTPVRRISISGEDVGKVWITQYIYYLPNKDQNITMEELGFFRKYLGDTPKSIAGNEFVRRLGSVLAKHVAELTANTQMGLSLDFAPEGEGEISCWSIQAQYDISFHQCLSCMLDAGAFYELWMDDPGEGPALLRWRELWSGPNGVTVTADDIASINCWRDDSRTSNWYFCFPRSGVLEHQTDRYWEAMKAGDICDGRNDQWSKEVHYGWRKMEVKFSLLPPFFPGNNDQPNKGQYLASVDPMTRWIQKRTQKLRDLNKNNSRLESCTATVSGNEEMRPGTWVTVQKKDAAFRYYAVKVEHRIHLFQSFTTTLHGMRGEKLTGDGTYRAELDLKGALK